MPLKILFQQVFIFCSSIFRKHRSFCFFCSFEDLFSSKFLVGWASLREGGFLPLPLLVQFSSVNVPCETVDRWSLKSSLIFILRNCFNFRAARFKNEASLLSSHECFLKKLGSLFRQLLSKFIMLSKSSMLTIRTFWYAPPSLPLISQSDDATGNRTRIRGGIPKIYLKETWNMVCGSGRGHDDRNCSRSTLSPPIVTPRTLVFRGVTGSPCRVGPSLSLVPPTHAEPAVSSIPRGAAHTRAQLCALPFP